MKINIKTLFIIALFFFLTLIPVKAEIKNTDSRLEYFEKEIIPQSPDTFPIVRHIVMKGSQAEIGKKLAEIAIERYKLNLTKNPSPFYGKARYEYLKLNYPQLLGRIAGVMKAYGLDPYDTSVDPTALIYSITRFGCSMIFFPGKVTESGNSIAVRNMDFSNGTASQMMRKPRQQGEPDIFREIYVMEVYPVEGYACLYLSAIDLLSGTIDGVNEHGLSVYGLVDLGRPEPHTPPTGNKVIGLNPLQVMRMLLENCKNIDEAKLRMLTCKSYDILIGMHFLVADSSGNSFIFEINQEDGQAYIQDSSQKPHVMTNSSVWKIPSEEEFPTKFDDDYDSLYRHIKLTRTIESEQKKFSESSMVSALEGVFPRMPTTQLGSSSMTLRPLWQVMYDLNNLKMKVRFWLKDTGEDKDGRVIFQMSDWFEFQLKKK